MNKFRIWPQALLLLVMISPRVEAKDPDPAPPARTAPSGIYLGGGASILGFGSAELRSGGIGLGVGYLGELGTEIQKNRIPLGITLYMSRFYLSGFTVLNGSYALRATCSRCAATEEISNDAGVVVGYHTNVGDRGVFRLGFGAYSGFKSSYASVKSTNATVDVSFVYKIF